MVDLPELDPREAEAAEFALGLLDGGERADALRRQLADPEFAALVATWRDRLAALCDGYGEAPPPELWAAIEARLGVQGDGESAVSPLARRLRLWRGAALGASAVAAGLLAVVALRPDTAPPVAPPAIEAPARPVVIAQLVSEGDGPRYVARYETDGALTMRAAGTPGGALEPELWVIPADGTPVSLGLVAREGESRLTVAEGHRALMAEGATLAITMEPADTAPHAAPSGPPVAAGIISTI